MNPTDLIISQTDGRPMYLQIVEQIKQRVGVGDWPAGAELPSIRQLAIALRVSVITIKRAYYELERDGVILTHQGKPSTIAPNLSQATDAYHEELARLLEQLTRLALRLGLSVDELTTRLHAAWSHSTDGPPTPEQEK